MRAIFIAALLTATQCRAEVILADSSTLPGQPYWSSSLNYTYYTAGAAYARIGAATNALSGSVPVAGAAGNWRVWVLATAPTYTGTIGIQLGSSVGSITVANGLWSRTDVLAPASAFTNVTLTITNNSGGSTHDYHIAAVYVTSNTNEAPVASALIANTGSLFIDYSPPTVTNSTDIVKGNLIPNSSFELGMFQGWGFTRVNGSNRVAWISDAVDTTNAHSGVKSARINTALDNYQIRTPVVRLRGSNVWRPYTFSFWAKASALAPTLTGNIVPLIPAVSGFPYTNSYSFNFGAPSTSWTRYSTNIYLCSSPTREIYATLQHVGDESYTVWIDDVQLEEGSLTDYSAPMEAAIQVRNAAAFFSDETPAVQVVVNNPNSATTATVDIEVYDWQNAKVASYTNSRTAATGLSTNNLSVYNAVGAYRITGRLREVPGYSRIEANYTVLPYTAQSGYKTNSLIGVHPVAKISPSLTNVALGMPWARTLSAAAIFNWKTIEATQGVYDWADTDFYANSLTNLMVLASFGDIYSGGSMTPTWAITNSFPQLDPLSNYCYQVVNRYKDRIKYWELMNEPQYHYSTSQLATITEWMVGGVKAADATAVIIGGGGLTDVGYITNWWAATPAGTKSSITAVSVHAYPPGTDWMDNDSGTGYRNYSLAAAAMGVPIWNTESGTWGFGVKHGDLAGWISGGTYAFTHLFEEVHRRSHWQTSEKTMRTALRTLGWGLKKYFYYDGRLADYGFARIDTNPTWFEYDDSLRPDALALLYPNWMLGAATTVGPVTNTSAGAGIEAWLFKAEDGAAVIAAFSQGRQTNINLTTTNSQFGVFNHYGQYVITNSSLVTITRQPVYLLSRILSTNQLADTFASATAANATDNTAPNVSIDVSPYGAISAANLPLRFKWTAIDNLKVNTDRYPSNVLTRYKLTGRDADWSAWSPARRLVETSMPSIGTYCLTVQTKDSDGLATNEINGPVFYTPGVNLTVGTLNATTLIIGQ